MDAPNYDGQWLFKKLSLSTDFRVVMKLYSRSPICNETLTGFLCEAIDLFGKPDNKQYVIEKAKQLLIDHKLPLSLENMEYHEKRFKIKIIK